MQNVKIEREQIGRITWKYKEDNSSPNTGGTIDLMDDDDNSQLSTATVVSVEPSNADLMRKLLEISANTADNIKFKAAASKWLNTLEQHAGFVDKRLEKLETRINELNANKEQAPSSANDWLDQRKLRNNVSIVGIPVAKDENIAKLIVDMCSVFGMAIAATDLKSFYRVAHAKSNMIIAKFKSFESKSLLLAAKAKKRLTLADIPNIACGASDASKPIYINSHVTPVIGRMLHSGRIAMKEKKILACWVTARGFMVKISNASEPKVLHTLEELNGLVGVLESMPAQPTSFQTGKRNKPEDDSPNGNKPKSKIRNTSRGRSGAGPLSTKTKNNKEQK